jgi:hypothetical protein
MVGLGKIWVHVQRLAELFPSRLKLPPSHEERSQVGVNDQRKGIDFEGSFQGGLSFPKFPKGNQMHKSD